MSEQVKALERLACPTNLYKKIMEEFRKCQNK